MIFKGSTRRVCDIIISLFEHKIANIKFDEFGRLNVLELVVNLYITYSRVVEFEYVVRFFQSYHFYPVL